MKVLAGDFQDKAASGAQSSFMYAGEIGQFMFPDPSKEFSLLPKQVTYYMDKGKTIGGSLWERSRQESLVLIANDTAEQC